MLVERHLFYLTPVRYRYGNYRTVLTSHNKIIQNNCLAHKVRILQDYPDLNPAKLCCGSIAAFVESVRLLSRTLFLASHLEEIMLRYNKGKCHVSRPMITVRIHSVGVSEKENRFYTRWRQN